MKTASTLVLLSAIALSSASAATAPKGCFEVSVQGDATFCIGGPICAGFKKPSGTNCPAKGAVAVKACRKGDKSYDAKTGTCIAPVSASCQALKNGAYGCVWGAAAAVPAPAAATSKSATTATSQKSTTTAPAVGTAAATTKPGFFQVSVERDATYYIQGPICSGKGDKPAGTKCPVKGDAAVKDCYKYLKSYNASSAKCAVPFDATCKKIKTGAWGCVLEAAAPAGNSSGNATAANATKAATSADTIVKKEVDLSAEVVETEAGVSVGAVVGVVAAAAALVGAAVYAIQRRTKPESPVAVGGTSPGQHSGSFIQA